MKLRYDEIGCNITRASLLRMWSHNIAEYSDDGCGPWSKKEARRVASSMLDRAETLAIGSPGKRVWCFEGVGVVLS